MSLLGTMMVRAGLLSDEQLAAVQAGAAERKLSFVEALLAHGFADEDSVVGFLHSKLMIPKVGAAVLDSVDRNALDRIPGELAARHAVLPISSDETGNLTLAMVDPTDMKAVDAISAHTGAYLVRAVAPLRIIRAAIGRHYGIEPPTLPVLLPPRAASAPVPAARPPSAPAVSAPIITAPVITAPVITAPVITAPSVSAPAVSAPVIGAASVATPPVPAASSPAGGSATAPVSATPAAAPAPAKPVAAPTPAATAPASSAPSAPPAGRPAAPSGAAIRPAAVIQPSAVIMPGPPRPAAVLPATALAPSPYGIAPQASRPLADPTPVPVERAPSAPLSRAASGPVPAASFTGTSGPVPAASLAGASGPVPAASYPPSATVTQPVPAGSSTATQPFGSRSSPPTAAAVAQNLAAAPAAAAVAAGSVTQPLISGGLAAAASATSAPVSGGSLNSSAAAQPFAAGGLLAAAAASAAASAGLAPSQPTPDPAELSELRRGGAPTTPAFSGAMATLRQHDAADSGSSRATTLPGIIEPGDTLTGGSRPPDVVDIPLDDLETAPGGSTLIPGEPLPTDRNFDAAKTQTWNPPSFGVANEIVPLSPEAFHRLLPRFATVKTRDEVTDLLLDFLAEGFSRVIMFVHIKGEIRGRDARGEDLLVEAVRQIRIPAGGPSMFSTVIERRSPYFGPMRTDTPIDAAFFSALGGVEGVVLVLPVLLRDKVPLLVFASGSSNPVDPRSLNDLTHEVAAALERIIVLEKARK